MRVAFPLSLVCLLLMAPIVSADEILDQYYADAAAFYADTTSALTEVLETEPAPEDVPVIFALAREAGTSPQQIAKLRAQGDGWHAIMQGRGLKPASLYFIIAADFDSKTYAPLFEKFRAAPESEWDQIVFTDEDVVNLVNLRFIYRRHGYSVFEVMAMRDFGKPFAAVNQQIAVLKEKLMEEEKAAKKKAKEAKEEAGDASS